MGFAAETYRPGVNSARVDATAASVGVALPSGGGTLEIVNTSATLFVFCVTGVGAQTASLITSTNTGPGWAVPPMGTKRIRIPPNHDNFAAIGSGAGPTAVFVSRGDGGTS
jgi:hypothetical protein